MYIDNELNNDSIKSRDEGVTCLIRGDLMGSMMRINSTSTYIDFVLSFDPQTAMEGQVMKNIWMLRREKYREIYPDVETFEDDPHDPQSCVIYTLDDEGRVSSTARIAYDGELGIPEAALVARLVDHYHQHDINFAELGRFVIDDAARGALKSYFRAFYELALVTNIDVYVMFVQKKWVSLYRRLMDAKIVAGFEQLTFGGDQEYVCMEWCLEKTRPRFFKWCDAQGSCFSILRSGQDKQEGDHE